RRIIFLGDIHGCYNELVRLLTKMGYEQGRDLLVSVGDLINKGPDSAKVLDFVMEHNMLAVRGNHEDGVIRIWDSDFFPSWWRIELVRLAYDLMSQPRYAALLRRLPYLINLARLDLGDILVVHAGLQAELSLDQQNPRIITTIDYPPPELRTPTLALYNSRGWFNVFRETLEQGGLKSPWLKDKTIIYGHDPQTGVVKERNMHGLDSGCYLDYFLTGMVV
ncbi:Metallo-dependent phosphatase-like protein, partial [Dimargaris cristalligena]